MNRWFGNVALLGLLALAPLGPAQAQETPKDIVAGKEEIPTTETERKEDGLHYLLNGTANFSFSHNRRVVGQPDGTSFNFGILVNSKLDLYWQAHLWLNSILLEHQQTKTPTLHPWVKTLDRFEIRSAYLYRIPSVPWLGPFAAFSLKTSLFPGHDARATATEYAIIGLDGQREMVGERGTVGTIKAQSWIELTSALAPLRLAESAGVFALPIDRKALRAEFRLGVGARQVFVQNALALADDAETKDIVEYKRLEDFIVSGGEFQADLSGLWREFITYSLGIEVMYPFWLNIDMPVDGAKRFHVDLRAKVGVKIFEWAALEYSLSVIREPFLVDEWQVQNGLMLSLGATLSGVKKFGVVAAAPAPAATPAP